MSSIKIDPEKFSHITDEIIVHESDSTLKTQVQKFMPNPNIALIFQYGKTFEFSHNGIDFSPLPKIYIVYPYLARRFVIFRMCQNIRTAIFVFQPTVFTTLFGTNTNTQAKIMVDAIEALPAQLYNQLYKAFFPIQNLTQNIKKILTILDTQSRHNHYKINTLQKCLDEIKANMGMPLVTELADKCHVSKRTLERYFKSILMTTPDRYAKVVRFQCILKNLLNNQFRSKAECAAAFGLTDYSHMVKEFKSYAGETPKEYLRNLELNYLVEKKFHEL